MLFRSMAKKSIVDDKLKELIKQTLATKETLAILEQDGEASQRFYNKISDVYEYSMSAPSQQTESCKGTLFGYYNAITGYYQNVKTYKSDESKLVSIMEGEAHRNSERALTLAKQLLN